MTSFIEEALSDGRALQVRRDAHDLVREAVEHLANKLTVSVISLAYVADLEGNKFLSIGSFDALPRGIGPFFEIGGQRVYLAAEPSEIDNILIGGIGVVGKRLVVLGHGKA